MSQNIVWHNKKIYNHDIILERMRFVETNMNGLLPLYGKEKQKLMVYAKINKLPPYEMVCLRNTIKIQKEINASKFFGTKMNTIKNNFIKLVTSLLKTTPSESELKIRNYFKILRLPFNFVLKIVSKMPEFAKLSTDNIKYIGKIRETIHASEIEITRRSMEFEHVLEKHLQNNNLTFRTEEDIRLDGDYTVTPDILFDEPITLNLHGEKYKIRWMDAKNYILVDVPFIIKSLHKQADKYNNIFGMGAFVFHYGFDSSIKIPGTVILDGSFLEPL